MKRLSLFHKIVFTINSIIAFLLFAAFFVPHISVEHIPFLSLLSLAVPVLVILNFLFLLYWVLLRKKSFLLSLTVLILGYFILGSFVKFKLSEESILKADFSVMSYNVRGFNVNEQLPITDVFGRIKTLIDKEDPDVICFQEIDYRKRKEFDKYPYQQVKYIYNQGKVILGILSKYPILESSTLDFPNTANDGAYADILYKGDTLRIYNLHLQSLRINPSTEAIASEPSGKLYNRLMHSFQKQQEQARFFEMHRKKSPYKTIVCGDFNNTQFSNVYKVIKGDLIDTFDEIGTGYGQTYNFLHFPLRIDFILADDSFTVKSHKNYDEKLSDHFPIMASFELKSD